MQVIDAQLHDIGPWSDWTAESEEIQHRVLLDLLVAYVDAVGVQGAVLFPGGHAPWAIGAVEALPDRFSYVPHISPDEPDVDAAVREAKHTPGFVGLRALIGWPVDGAEVRRLEAGDWDPVFAACQKHGVPVFLFITGWLQHAATIAARFPELNLIVDHLGLRQPPMDDPENSAIQVAASTP